MDEFIRENAGLFDEEDMPEEPETKTKLPEGLVQMKPKAVVMPQPSALKNDHVAQAAANAPDEDTPSEDEPSDNDEDQWDVETILSTYTNTDNRPHIVKIKSNSKPSTSKVVAEPEDEEVALPVPTQQVTRARNETAEEKKARKQAAKQNKRQRKEAKKEMKTKYNQELVKQRKIAAHSAKGFSVIKF